MTTTTDIDMKTAQFSYELSLSGIETAALNALTERLGKEPSRWHPFKRAAYDGAWNALYALAGAATEHRREQEKASK